MALKEKKKKKTGKVKESERNIKFIVAGWTISILLVGYVFISIRALSDDAAAVFSGLSDPDDLILEYNFDSFENIFPGELEGIKALEVAVPITEISNTTTSTSTATTTDTTTTTSSEDALVETATSTDSEEGADTGEATSSELVDDA